MTSGYLKSRFNHTLCYINYVYQTIRNHQEITNFIFSTSGHDRKSSISLPVTLGRCFTLLHIPQTTRNQLEMTNIIFLTSGHDQKSLISLPVTLGRYFTLFHIHFRLDGHSNLLLVSKCSQINYLKVTSFNFSKNAL